MKNIIFFVIITVLISGCVETEEQIRQYCEDFSEQCECLKSEKMDNPLHSEMMKCDSCLYMWEERCENLTNLCELFDVGEKYIDSCLEWEKK